MYEIAPIVEVAYLDLDLNVQRMCGSWHIQNERDHDGPLLVMNPNAWDVMHACCWSVPWTRIVRISVITPALTAECCGACGLMLYSDEPAHECDLDPEIIDARNNHGQGIRYIQAIEPVGYCAAGHFNCEGNHV